MGAESSVQRDGKSQEDAAASASASAGDLSAEVKVLPEEDSVLDSKALQKNGQISSMTSLNGHSEDNTLAEVGQPDGVSVAQKEESPETTGTIQDEVAPQVNGEKVEKESPDANDISTVEEKAAEEKPDDASEVGFKKIFRFVGFKFTLKKDKSEEKDPVKLLTVKDKEEGEEVTGTDEPTKEEETVPAEEKDTAEEKESDTETPTVEAELIKDDTDKVETTDATAEETATEATDESIKAEGGEKDGEASPPSQETTVSPFRKLFSGGLFSNLRKKASIKKTKEEEDKEAAVEEDETAMTEETAAAPAAAVDKKEEEDEAEQEIKEEAPATPEEEKSESKEEAPVTPKEEKSDGTPEPEVTVENPAPPAATTDETKQEEEKAEGNAEEEKAPVEATSEAELLSSQEKTKPQGSPLKKLFTGAGLKKLSTKKQKTKKDAESKLTESGEQTAEQLQSSTESAEAPKVDSGLSSPEESGEHVIAVEVTQNGSSQEPEGEVASDGEKKKEGIIAWSSFKRLVTPKKLVKRSSDSEDEAADEKPAKSATLSSSESAALADKSVEEEAKEEKPIAEEPKTENTEKLVSSTEEPKKKMDTSVSWEALMCMGGTKKRTRRTSDSDDEETKTEEEATAAAKAAAAEVEAVEGKQEVEAEVATVTPQNPESEEEVVSSPEPLSTPPPRESAWDTLKRIVMPKNRAKVEEKPEESADQVQSDGEAPKEESSFSLRKFFPGRRKKKVEKQASAELGSGEEDSDTPAVVPLSEYDRQIDPEHEAPADTAAVQIKVSAEDRSPSWIPATVEDGDDKHDQLSDIPEEAENAATPKSVDTDAAGDEDQAMLSPKDAGRMGRRLSTAEVKPVAPAPASETTSDPQKPKTENAEEVLGAIEAEISEIPPQTSVTVIDVPVEVASEKTEYEPPTENAECKANNILEPHARSEAMAICTGLGTKEIAKVFVEKPAEPLVECVAVVRDSLSTEVLVEEIPPCSEEATAGEDEVARAQLQQVDTTELEPVVEDSQSDMINIEAAGVSFEPEIEKVGVISTVLEGSEVVQDTTLSKNSPKDEICDPITPTPEAAVCTQSIEVTEPTVETKEVKMDLEQFVATEEITVLKEVVQVVSEEISTVCENTKTTSTKETEPDIPVVTPNEEVPLIQEEVVGEAEVECTVLETVASKKMDEVKEDVQQTSEIESQSMVIAQTVIHDAVDEVSKDTSEPEKPTTPTGTTPTPAQAKATTEKEIKIESEAPVITDTPVPVICHKTVQKPLQVAMEVIDSIPIEVTENLDFSVEEEGEKKPDDELKQAEKVNVSEEIVEEEVAESQTSDAAGEVKSQSEETKPENKEKAHEIHIPVQVVLQTAMVVEDPTVEEEAVVEFDSNGPVAEDAGVKAESPASACKLSTLSEEATGEVSGPSQAAVAGTSQSEKSQSGKCAEVMAQVIEVIEEAVKEIEPVSTEVTAAS